MHFLRRLGNTPDDQFVRLRMLVLLRWRLGNSGICGLREPSPEILALMRSPGAGTLPPQEVYEVYGGLPPVFWDSLRLLSLQALMTPGLFRPQPTKRHLSQGSSTTSSSACEPGQTGAAPPTTFPL